MLLTITPHTREAFVSLANRRKSGGRVRIPAKSFLSPAPCVEPPPKKALTGTLHGAYSEIGSSSSELSLISEILAQHLS